MSWRAIKLEALLDSHDCHLSPNDGCECVEARFEMCRLEAYKKNHKYTIDRLTNKI